LQNSSKENDLMMPAVTEEARLSTEESILSPEAVDFLYALQRRFSSWRRHMLMERDRRQREFDLGNIPEPLRRVGRDTEMDSAIRPLRSDFGFGKVMLTGPPDRESLSRGLASGAGLFIADFDDCLSPTWENCLESHAGLRAAYDTLALKDLAGKPAALSVRPRDWSHEEKHFLVDGGPISAALFDFGLSIFHIAGAWPGRPVSAHFSLSKLESHREARMWADIFCFAEQYLNLSKGSIRVMVTIDTVSAASEMDEILFELREYATALECSPLSYLSSFVRSFRVRRESLLPQRSDINLNQPFLQAYQELLVHTCRKHEVRAISSSLQLVRNDVRKARREQGRESLDIRNEIELGFDGICVTDPDLIDVALSAFELAGKRRSSIAAPAMQCHITSRDLISPSFGRITMMSLKENVESALEYLEGWLAGHGSARLASGVRNMASAELCRAQLWQWTRHSAQLSCGLRVSRYVVECLIRDSLASIELRIGEAEFAASKFFTAAEVLLSSCTDVSNPPLPLRAYAHIC
jgi:malate synthase